ncbi:MAG: NTP transferase domain-containing protein [Gammaproteobacteria bacterium]|nr:NTP transferase domain-containing protein [Gammaproteobacteria bacterium]
MPKVVTIVQARMGSTRFPGKMMASLHGRTMMEWVLKRCMLASTVDQVVLATSDLPRDDALVEVAEQCGVAISRGQEEDVLGRFAKAAKLVDASTVVRVCGDRPLIDPQWTDLAVQYYVNEPVDLAFNHISSEHDIWPRGFGVEVFSATNLYSMDETQSDRYFREHVTPYIWQNQDIYKVKAVPSPIEIADDCRFDVDTVEDFEQVRSYTESMNINVSAREILSLWSARNPDSVFRTNFLN